MITKLKTLIAAVPALCFALTAHAAPLTTSISEGQVPDVKITPLGLYLSSQDAHFHLSANPDLLFIDVRDPVEISQTGLPASVDAIVPVRIHSSEFDQSIREYVLKDNPHFIEQMQAALTSHGKNMDDPIIITCGSGWRSAVAVEKLHAAGYTNVWHIVDGYEGEAKAGRNMENAWRLANLPWNDDITENGFAWMMYFE